MPRIISGNRLLLLLLSLSCFWPFPGESFQKRDPAHLAADLTELPLERLMDIEVTSVSKKAEKLSEAAAAVYVVTEEDIRRSGVTSIPEALRMVPGVQVAKIDSNKWAVSVRGFNDQFANKLLVLIDGRSVYAPLFSGVFWEVQDTLIEDIDRIEVIRGPGATLWGANAVNGVINIITKKAAETQGVLVGGGGGTEERGFGGVRYGGKIGENLFYRVYSKYFRRDEGFGGNDDWWMARGGGRVDWGLTEKDHLTFQGDFYDGNTGWRLTTPTLTAPFSETRDLDANFTGGNFLSRWTRRFDEKSDLTLQFYYDLTRTELDLREIRHTIDVDFQHRFPWGGRQELVWGIEYRLTRDDIRDTFNFSFNRDSRTSHLVSGFLQDEIVLLRDRLRLVVGSKFEANDYSGFEIQPNLRLLWTPHERHAFWASVSRAVRTPTRADEDVRFNIQAFEGPGIPILLRVFGNRAINAEDLLAAETGYRVWPTDRLSLDLALFFNRYTNLRTAEPGSPFLESGPPPQHVVVPVILANKMDGIVYGAEFCADWTIFDWWRVVGVYSFLRIHLDLDDDSLSAGSLDDEKRSPEHQVSLRTMFDLPWNLELDAWFRYVDGLPALSVGHYVTLDLRLGWRPVKNLEVSVVGQNLLDNHHLEFRPTALSTQATEVERSVYGKLLWSF